MATSSQPWPQRLIAALPDAITAGFFLTVWLAPMALGESTVRNAMLVMLIEFIVVHSSAFLGMYVLADEMPRRKRLLGLAGFALIYLLFVGMFALVFREWWPLVAFGWLLLGKFAGVLSRRARNPDESKRMTDSWALSVVFYIGGVFLTIFAPVPRLGMTETLQPQFGLEGSGVWVDEPQRVVAFGLLYFALTAWSKWRDWSLPASTRVSPPGKH